VTLLRHSYALILGLWQMAGKADDRGADTATAPQSTVFGWSYADELADALRALWEGTLARAARDGGSR
jgi:hypothetical protein